MRTVLSLSKGMDDWETVLNGFHDLSSVSTRDNFRPSKSIVDHKSSVIIRVYTKGITPYTTETLGFFGRSVKRRKKYDSYV